MQRRRSESSRIGFVSRISPNINASVTTQLVLWGFCEIVELLPHRTSHPTFPSARKLSLSRPIITSRINSTTNNRFSIMASFVYTLFQKAKTHLAPSHQAGSNHPEIVVYLVIVTTLVGGGLVGVFIETQSLFLIPILLAIIATFHAYLTVWVWIHLAVPLAGINCLITCAVLVVAYRVAGYGDITKTTFFVVLSIWAILAAPALYICAQFYKFGRRLLTHPTQSQG